MRIATVSEVATPWSCLQEDLRQVGIDPARLDRSTAENLNALTEGRIEAAQFFEPVVEEALASGKGHLWYAASARGRTSYTAFVTTHERLVRDAEPLLCMVRAIQRTQQWIYSQSAHEIAAAISSIFPALDIGVLAAALARYQSQSVWDVIRFFPKTALIVCDDPSYPGGSSVGRRHTLLASTTA
jgi:NitT/TauT family transport system substrate-binding protein